MPTASARSVRLLLAIAINLSLSICAGAHPGHGPLPDASTPQHYATSPMHWAELIAAMVVAGMAAWLLRGTWRKRAA
jgi:hypothetical protein